MKNLLRTVSHIPKYFSCYIGKIGVSRLFNDLLCTGMLVHIKKYIMLGELSLLFIFQCTGTALFDRFLLLR